MIGRRMTLELHPLNHDFEWVRHTGPFRRVSEAQARQYDEQGWLVLEDAFDPDTIAAAIREIDPLEAKAEAFLRTQPGGKLFIARAGEITFTTHMVTRSEYGCASFCAGVLFQRDLRRPDRERRAALLGPGGLQEAAHRRSRSPGTRTTATRSPSPQQYLTCWVALTDATEANGCPWVVPGIHRLGTLSHWMTDLGWRCLEKPAEAVPAPVRAGGIVVFSSLTPHRTGPNLSDDIRKAYIVQFAPDGAAIVPRDHNGSDAPRLQPCDAPDRQFPILENDRPV